MVPPSLNALLSHPLVALVRERASARGVAAVLVGGALRDTLLLREPHDFDFAVQGDAIALGRAVANALSGDFYVMDDVRGTARVISQQIVLDFAKCRGDSWHDDLLARDFTLNAIAIDLRTGDVLDDTGGLRDIDQRVVRATTPNAIADDPVRALRAVRMAHQFGFRLDEATWHWVQATGRDILRPSAERLRDELFDIFVLPNATPAVRALDDAGLLTHIVPEIEPMRTQIQTSPHRFNVLDHTWHVMHALDRELANLGPQVQHGEAMAAALHGSINTGRPRAALLRFAALLHDSAKPDTELVDGDGRIHFYGHESAGSELAVRRARALKLSSDEVSWIRTLVANHMRPNQMARMPKLPTQRALYRFFRDTGDTAPALALFALADCWGKRGESTGEHDCDASRQIAALLIERYYTRFDRAVAPAPLLSGREVIDLGVQPGPRIGEILEAVREAQMAGELATHAEALALAQDMAR